MEVFYVDNNNITEEIFRYTYEQKRGILVWRNATRGAHKVVDVDWFRENVDLTQSYGGWGDFEGEYYRYNDTNRSKAYKQGIWYPGKIPMSDILDHTLEGEHRAFYVGFNFKLLEENPKAREFFIGLQDKIVEPFLGPKTYSSITGTYPNGRSTLSKFAFLYYGTKYYSPAHNAPSENSWLQIHNTKRWVIIHPRYYPYMMPVQKDVYVGFFIDFPEIPKVAVDIGPGDWLYFPPYYMHMVVNMEDTWGMGYGIRDHIKSFKWILKSLLVGSSDEAGLGVSFAQFFNMIKAQLMSTRNYPEEKSAVSVIQIKKLDDYQIKIHDENHADLQNKFAFMFDPNEKQGVYKENSPSQSNVPTEHADKNEL